MGIVPIPGLCGVSPENATRTEREVEPALALTRCDRMEEDAYQGNHEGAERGMEEEDSEPAEDRNADESLRADGDPNIRVSFFA
ncbi:hypothetical protein P8935_18945 [Telmatobacter sp. DSM 110680]|uniref:Uncharacterized protein n=1 Tax=Telmatobacter sp. DSM 110680 TaxID=3036704 RepID=A0AAU7DHW4_9BACT